MPRRIPLAQHPFQTRPKDAVRFLGDRTELFRDKDCILAAAGPADPDVGCVSAHLRFLV